MALVEFASPPEAQAVLVKDKQMMGNRYIEVFLSTPQGGLAVGGGLGGVGWGGGCVSGERGLAEGNRKSGRVCNRRDDFNSPNSQHPTTLKQQSCKDISRGRTKPFST